MGIRGAHIWGCLYSLDIGEAGDKSYDNLIDLLTEHYDSPPSIVQRFKFHTRTRVAGESIAIFVAALGQTCDFGAALEDMIQHRLVCGVNDDKIQR